MYSPYTHLAIARQHQADRIREAERHRLADIASGGRDRTSIVSRVRSLVRRRRLARDRRAAALEACSKGRAP